MVGERGGNRTHDPLVKRSRSGHPTTRLTIAAVQYTTATSTPATSPMLCSGFFSISKWRLNQSKPMSKRRAAFSTRPEPAYVQTTISGTNGNFAPNCWIGTDPEAEIRSECDHKTAEIDYQTRSQKKKPNQRRGGAANCSDNQTNFAH